MLRRQQVKERKSQTWQAGSQHKITTRGFILCQCGCLESHNATSRSHHGSQGGRFPKKGGSPLATVFSCLGIGGITY